MLCGVCPFTGDPLVVVRRLARERPPRIRDRVPGLEVDPALESLTFWLLERDPAERPQSARDVLAVLGEMERGWKGGPLTPSVPATAAVFRTEATAATREVGRRWRPRAVLAFGAAAALIGVMAAVIGLSRGAAVVAPARRVALRPPQRVEPAKPPPASAEPQVTVAAQRRDVARPPGSEQPRAGRTVTAPPPATAASFAERYEAIGRRLNDAGPSTGQSAIRRLVERYRSINYLDALRSAPSRRAAEVVLTEIDRELSMASRSTRVAR